MASGIFHILPFPIPDNPFTCPHGNKEEPALAAG